MARTPNDGKDAVSDAPPETLAEMLFFLEKPEKRQELEKFRIKYEELNGPTDLTRRYTSTWSCEQQDWLIKHDIKRYFEGLPPFVKAFFRGKMESAARDGNLDDMPDNLLRLYVSGGMKPGFAQGR